MVIISIGSFPRTYEHNRHDEHETVAKNYRQLGARNAFAGRHPDKTEPIECFYVLVCRYKAPTFPSEGSRTGQEAKCVLVITSLR